MTSFGIEDHAAIVQRYPDVFRPNWWQRGKLSVGIGGAVALFLFGLPARYTVQPAI